MIQKIILQLFETKHILQTLDFHLHTSEDEHSVAVCVGTYTSHTYVRLSWLSTTSTGTGRGNLSVTASGRGISSGDPCAKLRDEALVESFLGRISRTLTTRREDFFFSQPTYLLFWPPQFCLCAISAKFTDFRQLSGIISRNSVKIPIIVRRKMTDFGQLSAKFIKQ